MTGMLIRENIATATDHWNNTVQLARAVAPGSFNAVVYQTLVNEDNDGAPNAYGPLNKTNPAPLDHLRNATNHADHVFSTNDHSFLWVGVQSATDPPPPGVTIDKDEQLRDSRGRFPILLTTGPFAGFYAPRTAVGGLNAAEVSYGAITPPLRGAGLTDGDLGLAIRPDTRQGKAFFFGDAGVQDKVGEISSNLFRTFFPRANQEDHPVTFILFVGVRAGTRDGNALDAKVRQQLGNLSAEGADELLRFLSFPPALSRTAPGPPISAPPKPSGPPSQMDQLRDALRSARRDPEGPYRIMYLNLLAVLRKFGLRSIP